MENFFKDCLVSGREHYSELYRLTSRLRIFLLAINLLLGSLVIFAGLLELISLELFITFGVTLVILISISLLVISTPALTGFLLDIFVNKKTKLSIQRRIIKDLS